MACLENQIKSLSFFEEVQINQRHNFYDQFYVNKLTPEQKVHTKMILSG